MKLQQPQGATAADALAVGDRCRVETKETDGGFARRVGTVAFAGPTVLGDGLWIGVALDQPATGRHDGCVSGVRYFRCLPDCGVLVRASRVERLTAPASRSRTPDRYGGRARPSSARRGAIETAKLSTPTHRDSTATEDTRRHSRIDPQRAASPSTVSRIRVNSSTREGGSVASERPLGRHVSPGLSAQHSGSPPRWGSPASRSRRSSHTLGSESEQFGRIDDDAAVRLRGDAIRAELEDEVGALRAELAGAEKQVREMTREREQLLETLAVAQDAMAAAAPASASGDLPERSSGDAAVASLRREKAMVARERDRLKSRVGLLTNERDSLQRQLSGLQRKLARRCAAAERGQAEEQELLRLREENHSLRGEKCLIHRAGPVGLRWYNGCPTWALSHCVLLCLVAAEMAAVREQVEMLNREHEQLRRQGRELRHEMGSELAALEAELVRERKSAIRSRRTAATKSADRMDRGHQQELAAARDDVERAREARAAAEVSRSTSWPC